MSVRELSMPVEINVRSCVDFFILKMYSALPKIEYPLGPQLENIGAHLETLSRACGLVLICTDIFSAL